MVAFPVSFVRCFLTLCAYHLKAPKPLQIRGKLPATVALSRRYPVPVFRSGVFYVCGLRAEGERSDTGIQAMPTTTQ